MKRQIILAISLIISGFTYGAGWEEKESIFDSLKPTTLANLVYDKATAKVIIYFIFPYCHCSSYSWFNFPYNIRVQSISCSAFNLVCSLLA